MIIYVNQWPTQLATSDGVIYNPTPEICRDNGYELESNRPPPTPEEIAAQQAAQQAADKLAQDALDRLNAMRQSYRNIANQFCTVANIPIVDKLDIPTIQNALITIGQGPNALMASQLAFELYVQINELRRVDGDDAWERI